MEKKLTIEPATAAGKLDRRKLLGLAGGAALVGGTPRKWSKPIVSAVVLPAHAQTSITDSAVPCTATTLSLPGFTLSCGDAMLFRVDHYVVDDSGECPVISLVRTTDGGSGVAPGELVVFPRVDVIPNAGFLSIFVGNETTDGRARSQFCDRPFPLPDSQIDLVLSITSTGGVSYTVTCTLSAAATSVTVSDIVFTPA